MIKKIPGLENTGNVYASLKGEGLVTDWKGRLIADVDNFFHFEAGVEIKDIKDLSIAGSSEIISEHPMIPDKITHLLQKEKIQVLFDLAYKDNNQLTLNSIKMNTNNSSMTISGDFGSCRSDDGNIL